jgi:amino acid adenylation domain-containing protein
LKLHELFKRSADTFPERVAVDDPARGTSITYRELDRLSESIALDVHRFGATGGQRVGLYASKSIASVSAIMGILRAENAYVPIDVTAPPRRGVEILADCDVSLVLIERGLSHALASAWERDLPLHELDVSGELAELGCDLVLMACEVDRPPQVEDLAYILYTSGSTGKPKGVMHTHDSARCFVDWCSETLEPTPADRFSSHAPFHFDLSILDLYVPLAHGAAVVLIGEEEGKNPLRLASVIAEAGISVWYSTPSVLRLLVEYGGPAIHDAADLRLVLFAGEVFAPRHLRRLQMLLPGRRYFNLYGPTETNVCTYYEVIHDVPPDRVEPYPIGKPITGDQTLVVDKENRTVIPGYEGELLVSGGTVMKGYWNRPDLNNRVFHVDRAGFRWYRTGDLVRTNEDGDYVFLGRADRMIKRRGYRIELGEIEAALYRDPDVKEAAVVAVPDSEEGVRVWAFLSWSNSDRPSMIRLKRFCAENLPLYMVPDRFTFVDELPKTSTDKIDYMKLKEYNG